MSRQTHEVTAQKLASIVSQVEELASRNGRGDLSKMLGSATDLSSNTGVRVVVVGQFNQGKSALVNALVAAPVCPVDDVLATSVPTVVSWGPELTATLVTEWGNEAEALRAEIEPSQLRQHVTDLVGEVGSFGSVYAEVALPSQILADGFTFVDTPGSGRAQSRSATNLTLLPEADAALMVTDATQELTAPELAFLQSAVALCPRVSCVVTKTDLQRDWRAIVEANSEHLDNAEIHTPIMANSAHLHELATEEGNSALREEAQIDELARHLQQLKTEVIAERHSRVAEAIRAAVEHVSLGMEAELRALTSAGEGTGQRVVQSLQEAEHRAGMLAQRSARWQQTLSDGAGDLVMDIEFDLRDRLRTVGREAEQLVDSSDPGKSWDDIGTWLADSITQAVSDNFVWTHQRNVHLADVVAQHFSLDGRSAIPDLSFIDADETLANLEGLDHVRSGALSIGQKFMIGLKGSYGGVLMFGLMTTLAGMALVNPISIAAGLVMGGFAYRQDAQQRLEQRRAEARAAVRKLIDETIFQVGKESRDRISLVKRTLRDHFTEVAIELKKSLNVSVNQAKQGANLPQSERAQRIELLTREVEAGRGLVRLANELTAGVPSRDRIGV